MASEREVAGVRCSEVLAELSEYLDGELPGPRRDQLQAHLQGCEACERFGGQFAQAIRQLRLEPRDGSAGTRAVFERLRARLRAQREKPEAP